MTLVSHDAATVRARYNHVAAAYDRLEVLFERAFYARWRTRLWAAVRGTRVLEIGTGTGKNIPYYPAASAVTAIDFSAGMAVMATVPVGSGTASIGIGLTNLASPTTLTLTGFSPPTGPTTGGTVVTIRGANLTGATSVTFDGIAGTTITVMNSTTLTVVAPAHIAGTVDISVTAGGQMATIHGYTYLASGSISPQPTVHAPPGSTSGSVSPQPTVHAPPGSTSGTTPMLQPARHDAPGSGTGTAPAPNAATAPTPTPEAQPGRR